MDSAALDFGRSLWRLYAEAGRPELDPIVSSACAHLPDEHALSVATVHRWLYSDEIPTSFDELNAIIEQLGDIARSSGNSDYRIPTAQDWISLWREATATSLAPGNQPSRAQSQTDVKNRVDGSSRIAGTNIQAGDIHGDVHVHHRDGKYPHAAAPTPAPRSPVVRVQNELETIEIYNERLAHIWIIARLQNGQADE